MRTGAGGNEYTIELIRHKDFEDMNDTLKYVSKDFRYLIVKSLSNHWSVGGFGSIKTSTYRNLDLSYEISPAVEFNVFPYAHGRSHRRRNLTPS